LEQTFAESAVTSTHPTKGAAMTDPNIRDQALEEAARLVSEFEFCGHIADAIRNLKQSPSPPIEDDLARQRIAWVGILRGHNGEHGERLRLAPEAVSQLAEILETQLTPDDLAKQLYEAKGTLSDYLLSREISSREASRRLKQLRSAAITAFEARGGGR
jgi:hypothetical protein